MSGRSSVLLLAALGLGSCVHGGALDDGVLYKGDVEVRFGTIPVQWQPLRISGADLAYRDEPHRGSVLVALHCNERDGDASLSVLTEHLIMGTTERNVDSQLTLPFDGREALRTTLRAKLDGVPMRYDIFVMKKDGCVYDLVYVTTADSFPAGDPEFERFVMTLHASPRGSSAHRMAAPALSVQ